MKKYPMFPLLIWFVFAGILPMSAGAEKIEPSRTLEGETQQNGKLTVYSEPPGIDVFLDGNEIGKTPVKLEEVEPGPHTIRITDAESEIHIRPNESLRLSYFKGEFIEVPEEEKEIARIPQPQKEKRIRKAPEKKPTELQQSEPLYLPSYPRNPALW